MNTQQNLILLRGLPGSGKTSFATLISENGKYPVFSVDDYFTDENGNYEFIFNENHKAYAQCLKQTEDAVSKGTTKVIVHNTFTMEWEIEPYMALTKKYTLQIFVLTVEHYHTHKNKHGISEEQIKKMAEKYQVKLF